MGWFSDKAKKESVDYSSLSPKERKEVLKSGKVPHLTASDKKDRRAVESYMKKLEKMNDGKPHLDLGGTAKALKDAAKGKGGSRVSGHMPSGPVNRDGSPRSTWW